MNDAEQNERELRQSLEETRRLNQQRVKARKKKRRQRWLKTCLLVLLISVLLAGLGLLVRRAVSDRRLAFLSSSAAAPTQTETAEIIPAEPDPEPETPEAVQTEPVRVEVNAPLKESEVEPAEEPEAALPEEAQTLDLELYSEHAILIDYETGTVLAEKDPDARIYPASMTKVMTALVACEQITDWDATFPMTQAIIDPLFLADATLAGFKDGEDVTMKDLVYGAILPSGAEATEALAQVVAGSEDAYAALMNEKAAELGCTDTHFVDASGLHNEEHYTTVRDMAKILQAAMENERCREALSAATYTSCPTPQNPDGVLMINKFLVRFENRNLSNIRIAAAKTGYTAQAMNCCASCGLGANGRAVLCVTAHAWTYDFCLDDHIVLYSEYAK